MTRQAWIELVVNWLPLVLLVGAVMVLIKRSNRTYKQHVDEANAVNAGILDVNREMLVELREIKSALKDRKS